ncbi:MAG: ATP-binding protein [Bacteroidia bacterium]
MKLMIWLICLLFFPPIFAQSISLSITDSSVSIHQSENIALVEDASSQIHYSTIESLETKILSQKESLAEQKRLIYASAIICMMFIVLSGLLYIQYDTKQRAFQRISAQNQLILEKNEEIMKQQQKIVYQKEQLRRLNRAKDRVFSILSHDLRAPIHSLQSFLKLLEMKVLSEKETQTLLSKISKTTQATSDTLDSLLHWSAAQMNGDVKCNSQIICLKEIIEEVVNLCNGQAEAKNIFIENQVQGNATLYADVHHIRLILRNLITNAIKFTHPNGEVIISASLGEKKTEIHVKDNGLGMTEAQINKLFHSQTHFSTVGTAKEKGLGLGLLLCKEFVEMNKGHLFVNSEVAKGSTFTLVLPQNEPISRSRILPT